jgi:hypothetical protein
VTTICVAQVEAAPEVDAGQSQQSGASAPSHEKRSSRRVLRDRARRPGGVLPLRGAPAAHVQGVAHPARAAPPLQLPRPLRLQLDAPGRPAAALRLLPMEIFDEGTKPKNAGRDTTSRSYFNMFCIFFTNYLHENLQL